MVQNDFNETLNETLKVCLTIPTDDNYYHQLYHKFKKPYVRIGDALRETVEEWNPQNAVLIDAPTGLGKTTFVYEELLPRALQANKNILLISNRVALSIQQKLQIMDIIESPDRGLLTDKGIQMKENFGNVCVITYHRLYNFLNDNTNANWIQNIAYVIADEAHYFASDSLFNDKCTLNLRQITSRFYHAVRIYMTATPWDVMYLIAEAEAKNNKVFSQAIINPTYNAMRKSRRILHYCFERNFSQYRLSFFKSKDEIISEINARKKEKFLVFIDNKAKAEEFMKSLDTSVTVMYLDADKKDTTEWKDLLRNEKFDSQVLISTSVLDCGVNINDSELKNIVVFTDNRTSMMQMVGRKRCKDKEKVNVWICDYSIKEISLHYHACQELLKWEEYYDSMSNSKIYSKLWYCGDKRIRDLFYPANNRIYKNENAFFLLHRKTLFYEKLINNETPFHHEVEEWFGKEHPIENNKLDEFYNSHYDVALTEEQENELREIITTMYRNSGKTEYQPKRNESLKHNALNNRLKDIEEPYEILNTSKGWVLKYNPELNAIKETDDET